MKNFISRITLAAALIFAMQTGFAKEIVVSASSWKSGEAFPTAAAGFYEASDLKWWLMNDANNLYIKIETTDKDAQGALMMNGLKFYFDTVKQKSLSTCLAYSRPAGQPEAMRPMAPPTGADTSNALFVPHRRENISRTFTKAVWKEMPYDLELEVTDFSASFTLDTSDVLTCNAVIPLKLICGGGLRRIHNLSIGILISGKDPNAQGLEKQRKEDSGRSDMSVGLSGNIGNSYIKQRGGPKVGTPQGGPAPFPYDENKHKSATLIDFWFLTQLALPGN